VTQPEKGSSSRQNLYKQPAFQYHATCFHLQMHVWCFIVVQLANNVLISFVQVPGKSGRTKASVVRRSLVWTYFDEEAPGLVKCRLCDKLIKRSGGNTTNLAVHLRSSHHKQYNAMIEETSRQKGVPSPWKWVARRFLLSHTLSAVMDVF